MSNIKVYIIGVVAKIAPLQKRLQNDSNVTVVGKASTLLEGLKDITDNSILFDKLMLFNNTYSSLDEFRQCMSEFFTLFTTDETYFRSELKYISNEEEYIQEFKRTAGDCNNFRCLECKPGAKFKVSSILDFCFNKKVLEDNNHVEESSDVVKEENKEDNIEVIKSKELEDASEQEEKLKQEAESALNEAPKKKGFNFKHSKSGDDAPVEKVEKKVEEKPKEKVASKKHKFGFGNKNTADESTKDIKEKTVEPKDTTESKPSKIKGLGILSHLKDSKQTKEDSKEESTVPEKKGFGFKSSAKKVETDSPVEDVSAKEDTKDHNLMNFKSRFKGAGSTDAPSTVSEDKRKKRDKNFVSKLEKSTKRVYSDVSEDLNYIAMHCLVGVTGDRGSGVSSTVANLADVAHVLHGMSVCVVSADLQYRSINHYYPKFSKEADEQENINGSLVECLNKPETYDSYSCKIDEGYNVISLGFDFDLFGKTGRANTSDEASLNRISPQKLIFLLGYLKGIFNLVIVDIPLRYYKYFPTVLVYLDKSVLCINNSIVSIANTVLTMEKVFKQPDSIESSSFKSKTGIAITKFNSRTKYRGKIFSPRDCIREFNDCSQEYSLNKDKNRLLEVIPMSETFDNQHDTGVLISTTDEEIRQSYDTLLKNIYSL